MFKSPHFITRLRAFPPPKSCSSTIDRCSHDDKKLKRYDAAAADFQRAVDHELKNADRWYALLVIFSSHARNGKRPLPPTRHTSN